MRIKETCQSLGHTPPLKSTEYQNPIEKKTSVTICNVMSRRVPLKGAQSTLRRLVPDCKRQVSAARCEEWEIFS